MSQDTKACPCDPATAYELVVNGDAYGYGYGCSYYGPDGGEIGEPVGDIDVEIVGQPCHTTQPAGCVSSPNVVKDERYRNLPPARRMRLVGWDRNVAKQFARGSKGFIMRDGGDGEFPTEMPQVNLPWIKSVILDQHGSPIRGEDDAPMEAPPGWFDSFVVMDEHNRMLRIQGQRGTRSVLLWEENAFRFVPDTLTDPNPVVQPGSYDAVSEEDNPYSFDAVLTPVFGANGSTIGFKIGYRAVPQVSHGAIMEFGGESANIPNGWIYCDGRELQNFEYPELFARIQYTHGGTGSSFQVPDKRDSGTFMIYAGARRNS